MTRLGIDMQREIAAPRPFGRLGASHCLSRGRESSHKERERPRREIVVGAPCSAQGRDRMQI